jgi:hypothetical protein
MKTIKCLGQKGQSSIEYFMLVLVISVVAFSIFEKMKGFFLDDQNSFLQQVMYGLEDTVENGHISGKYKSFIIRR